MVVPVVISSGIVLILLVAAGVLVLLSEDVSERIDIHDVEEIRGLEAKMEVPVNHMEPSLYDDYIQSGLDRRKRSEILQLERFYECMLVFDPEWDLIPMIENSTSTNVIAFYDTGSKEITMIEGSGSDDYLNYVLSHELTHALQDQNFDLESYCPTGSYDADMARSCVIEGDAMLTMDLWARENLGLYEMIKLQGEISMNTYRSDTYYELESRNEIISEMGQFPYEDGGEFVREVHSRSGYQGVDDLFTVRPPLSTEQIIHFDKYIAMEEPDRIEMNLEALDMEVAFDTTAGEKLITEILPDLDEKIEELDENRTGIGWGGDRFVYLENGTDFLSIFAVQWDVPDINDLFHSGFRYLMFREGSGFTGNSTILDGYHMNIYKEGERTYVLRSNDPGVIDMALDKL